MTELMSDVFLTFVKKSMQISLEITHYPFDKEYVSVIQMFIDELNKHTKIEVITNPMSTQLFGKFEDVMSAFQTSVKNHFELQHQGAFVVKLIQGDARKIS